MKFTVKGSRIICSRLDNTAEGEDTYRQVVEFDAHVDKVPPHVAARLTRGEISELEQILEDRQRIRENSSEKNLLEVLPGLIHESTEILNSVDELDHAMYEQLSESIVELGKALDSVSPTQIDGPTPVSRLRQSEVQKERLERIKHDL